MEALAAVLAGVGPRVRVDKQVRGQRAGALEALAALLALRGNVHTYCITNCVGGLLVMMVWRCSGWANDYRMFLSELSSSTDLDVLI